MVRITNTLAIPDAEFSFETSRSSGPGGQHVNTADTKVAALFDVAGSPSLSEPQRKRILQKLSNKINKDGVLRVAAEERRSQKANKEAALERLAAMLARALHKPKRRKPTKPSRNAKERRLKAKKQRAQLKKQRSGNAGEY